MTDGLDDPSLVDWRDITKVQKQWIGLCNGTVFDFKLIGSDTRPGMLLTVWTDKAEHLSKAKFIAVAPRSLLDILCEGESNRKLSIKAINPLNNETLPIYVTDAIEFEEGSDCRLGIPAAVESDYLFAKQNNIPVENNGSFLRDDEDLRHKICQDALSKNYGGYPTSARLHDWLISRQRYWGTPIPIVHCKKCGAQPVNYSDLPVLLPFRNFNSGQSSELKESLEWKKTTCPK